MSNYSKTSEDILREYIKERKNQILVEEELLTKLLTSNAPRGYDLILKQLSVLFKKDIGTLLSHSISTPQKEPVNIPPAPENAAMRGHLHVIKTSTSIDELNFKLKEAYATMEKVYANKGDMKSLWKSRLKTAHKQMIRKINLIQQAKK